MHFFNPAPVMRLVEVIAGVQTGERALALARATGEAMGKRVIDAADGPGFLVNRCGRPFGLEALRALQERLASVEEIDRIVRLGGGFRMGPFELQDLVGIDTGFEVSRSFFELSFGEPRWRPSPLSARMVASGRHGRKTGPRLVRVRGRRDPARARPARARAAAAATGGSSSSRGELNVADALRELAAERRLGGRATARDGAVPELIVDCGGAPGEEPAQGGPVCVLCADGSLAALDGGGPAAGFHALPPLAPGGLVELTRTGGHERRRGGAQRGASSRRSGCTRAGPATPPGSCSGGSSASSSTRRRSPPARASAAPADIDAGMELGLNHPRGPLAWGDEIGLDHVITVLDALRVERGDPAYRAAPLLRRLVLEGRSGRATGSGFHDYE